MATTVESKMETLERMLELCDEMVKHIKALDDARLKACYLATFEGENGGWLGRHFRDEIEDLQVEAEMEENGELEA